MQKLIIQGLTQSGKRFRPSDWAERLAGVMSQFQPPGLKISHLAYSPYCTPSFYEGVRAVVVDYRLKDFEPKAWQFLMDFASDNELRLIENQDADSNTA
ncbi:DUF3579 domain-containing protein [Brackiella oedipodis]|uniref:DUF3579 domain-containing protein n=1 Tax=Brackiella oedipodis TaxID=124225 RepID=UPI00048BAF25|nr:DUF3579 domain-containing protein [Brackiella oedipodis]